MYDVVIGLEVHCELDTLSKNFSSSENSYTKIPNIHVSPVDLGLPGILPVVNEKACYNALRTAMALHCENPDEIMFDRKNYFYSDLPKGYQITQVTKPMGRNGYLDILVDGSIKRVLIHQLHLEEDTASLEHDKNYSLIDYNRSGVPLMEIVTEPCLTSALEAVTFLEDLRDVFLYLGVSEAKTDKGQMRCDVNISLKEKGSDKLGTKVEMKNINSFTSVKEAIEYEIKRQSEALAKGEKIIQETRRIDEMGETHSMREKVDAIDYKYFVDANLPPVKITDAKKEELRSSIPKLKLDRILTYQKELGLDYYDASIIAKEKDLADYFEETVKDVKDVSLAVNFITTSILSTLNKLEITIEELVVTPSMLSSLINLVSSDKLSLDHAKKILYKAIELKTDPIKLIEKENLSQINDKDELIKYIKIEFDKYPNQVEQYIKEDNLSVINFFMGKVMSSTKRQANPNMTRELIKEELERMKMND